METSSTMVSGQTNTLEAETVSHYHHISAEERNSILELYYAEYTTRKIAAQL